MAQDKLEKGLSDMATARQARIESIESDVRHLKDEISQMHAQILALSVPRVVTGNNGPNFVRMLCNLLECVFLQSTISYCAFTALQDKAWGPLPVETRGTGPPKF